MGSISHRMTDAEIMAELGRRLQALRKRRKLSVVAAAERTGLSRRTVHRAEGGDNPTLATLLRLLRLYGRTEALDTFVAEPEVSPMALLDGAHRGQRG